MARKTYAQLYAEKPEAEVRADAVHMAKLLIKVRNDVNVATDRLVDEGDRVYFGSSNEADRLKDLAEELDSFQWDLITPASKGYDLYAEMRKLREEVAAAKAEAQTMRDAIAKITRTQVYEGGQKLNGISVDMCGAIIEASLAAGLREPFSCEKAA
jgi:hypothetical protein